MKRRRKTKRLGISIALATILVLAFTGSSTRAGGGSAFTAPLSGYQETPSTLATPASGDFSATVSADGSTVSYTLSYDGFETDVRAAHIHLGAPATTGGVTVFLCGGGGMPACPTRSGTVSGTFSAADVRAIAPQGLEAGDLPKLLEAMGEGATYVNVHSDARPRGEIRGQIQFAPGK